MHAESATARGSTQGPMPTLPVDGETLAPGERAYALVAEFDSVAAVMDAAERIRDAHYLRWDVHSPMPLHGINQSMGLRPTILPWITLVHGLVGCGLGLLLVWWINASTLSGVPTNLQGYRYLISGKPMFSLPANIPVIFEMTVLFAAIGTLLGLLGLNKLPMLHSPLQNSRRMRRATVDRFLVVIGADDPQFDLPRTADFLRGLHPRGLELVKEVVE
jgi:Protein of unknown function (DUF3341)